MRSVVESGSGTVFSRSVVHETCDNAVTCTFRRSFVILHLFGAISPHRRDRHAPRRNSAPAIPIHVYTTAPHRSRDNTVRTPQPKATNTATLKLRNAKACVDLQVSYSFRNFASFRHGLTGTPRQTHAPAQHPTAAPRHYCALHHTQSTAPRLCFVFSTPQRANYEKITKPSTCGFVILLNEKNKTTKRSITL